MATKPVKQAETTERTEEQVDSPILDSLTAPVRKMVARGKERGYVTYDELNKALPSDEVNSEQIEDTMTMLSEMGINVIESEESEENTTEEQPEATRAAAPATARRGRSRAHRRPRAHVSARDGQCGVALPRGRDRHRQADRGGTADHDRRHLREPADHARHHRVARPAPRRHACCSATSSISRRPTAAGRRRLRTAPRRPRLRPRPAARRPPRAGRTVPTAAGAAAPRRARATTTSTKGTSLSRRWRRRSAPR